jgi:SAM-dependent methyltransferase
MWFLKRTRNAEARNAWVISQLRALPAGIRILDVGAGECAYKPYCGHLQYLSQDIAQYDGEGNRRGLHTNQWDTGQLNFICDLYDIPEEGGFDAVLCTEVIEHVIDPVRAVEKLVRLLRPGGVLILTAPFTSLTHFAPYHFATGFSEYFYRHHLERLGLRIDLIEPNGGFFDFIDQELGRVGSVRRRYSGWLLDPISATLIFLARMVVRFLAALDGPRSHRRSSDLLCFGWHVVARRLSVLSP